MPAPRGCVAMSFLKREEVGYVAFSFRALTRRAFVKVEARGKEGRDEVLPENVWSVCVPNLGDEPIVCSVGRGWC